MSRLNLANPEPGRRTRWRVGGWPVVAEILDDEQLGALDPRPAAQPLGRGLWLALSIHPPPAGHPSPVGLDDEPTLSHSRDGGAGLKLYRGDE